MAKGKKIKFKKFKQKPLPTSLSGWIRSSVEDAKLLAKTPGFALYMADYNMFSDFTDSGEKTCYVCFGGAAIVGRGLVGPGEGLNGPVSTNIAHGMDSVRSGNLHSACINLAAAGVIPSWLGRSPDGRQVLPPGIASLFNTLSTHIQERSAAQKDGYRASWATYLYVAKRLEKENM